jgi:VCBS repeat-containing protein
LTIADADIGESSFVDQTIQGVFGNLTIDASGNWNYSADNGNPEIQALQAGDSFSETLTVTSVDGTTHDVVITINGTSEPPPEPPPPEPPPDEEPPVDEPPDEGEEEQGGTGEDLILEEIIAVPQAASPPVPDEAPSFAQTDEPESEPVNYGPEIEKQTAKLPQQPQPQAVNAQSLNIDALSLQVSDDEALNEQYELELLGRIDSMHLGMDDEAAQQSADDVNVQIFVGSTASLTVGIVSWVLRGGALLASFMSTVPLLNRFDPLPILKNREDEEDVEPDDDDDEKTQVREHNRKVDNMFSGKGDSQQ